VCGSAKHRPPLPEGPFAVIGLARSGQAAAELLARRGERVIGVDSASPEGVERLSQVGVEVILDGDGVDAISRARSVVKSPGVPAEAPAIVAARERGLAVIGELELAWRLLPNRFCAVTGTNGKTTVAELLGHVWRTAAEPVAVAGNVGTPLASLVDSVAAEATIVCEASSFQLEDSEAFAPECGVLLNVAPDHLDRHGTLEAYRDAKLNLFRNQDAGDFCVYNASDPALRGIELPGRGTRVAFCAERGAGCDAALTEDALELDGESLLRREELSLIGAHNGANAAAAAAAAATMGIERGSIAEALRSFPGVPPLLERVAVIDGVLYVNDSKATNVAAAAAGVRSFDGGVRAILGGSLKGGGFTELAAPVAERCLACYLIGPAAESLERDLATAWLAGVEPRRCADLADAVRAAATDAGPGEVVLLSPACASFDAFRDFEERGERFRELVRGLR
jgi:UDP-N-acetylmuramoylalanine--D-glutamate ligase